jgi:hypothetical protein
MLHTTEVRERDNPFVQFVHHQYNISVSDIGAPDRRVTRTNRVICKEKSSAPRRYIYKKDDRVRRGPRVSFVSRCPKGK